MGAVVYGTVAVVAWYRGRKDWSRVTHKIGRTERVFSQTTVFMKSGRNLPENPCSVVCNCELPS